MLITLLFYKIISIIKYFIGIISISVKFKDFLFAQSPLLRESFMLAVLLRKSPVQFSKQSISIQYNQIRQSSSIFNRLVDNLKNQVSKDKELETNLQQFKQTLTEVNQNETIKAAKEFITKAKVIFRFVVLSFRMKYWIKIRYW